MSMWHTVLQDASFRDVRFDVVALDEQDGKALVEHTRPFTDWRVAGRHGQHGAAGASGSGVLGRWLP